MGYLLSKSLKACPFLIRLNLYPLLGWAFLVTFAYYLRILARCPFNLWTLVLWSACSWLNYLARTFGPSTLRRPLPRVLLLLAGLMALSLVPLLSPPGHSRHERCVEPGVTTSVITFLRLRACSMKVCFHACPTRRVPWAFFASYWEYISDTLRQLTSREFSRLDWFYTELQERLEWLRSASRAFALFPRRAFSALDALMASVLRIDPQQAYTLSIWIHHIWLLHIAVIFSRLLPFSGSRLNHHKSCGSLLAKLSSGHGGRQSRPSQLPHPNVCLVHFWQAARDKILANGDLPLRSPRGVPNSRCLHSWRFTRSALISR